MKQRDPHQRTATRWRTAAGRRAATSVASMAANSGRVASARGESPRCGWRQLSRTPRYGTTAASASERDAAGAHRAARRARPASAMCSRFQKWRPVQRIAQARVARDHRRQVAPARRLRERPERRCATSPRARRAPPRRSAARRPPRSPARRGRCPRRRSRRPRRSRRAARAAPAGRRCCRSRTSPSPPATSTLRASPCSSWRSSGSGSGAALEEHARVAVGGLEQGRQPARGGAAVVVGERDQLRLASRASRGCASRVGPATRPASGSGRAAPAGGCANGPAASASRTTTTSNRSRLQLADQRLEREREPRLAAAGRG